MSIHHIYNGEELEIKSRLYSLKPSLINVIENASYLGKEQYRIKTIYNNEYKIGFDYWFRESILINKIRYHVYFIIDDIMMFSNIRNIYNRKGVSLTQKEMNNFKKIFLIGDIPYNLPKKEINYMLSLEHKLGTLFTR